MNPSVNPSITSMENELVAKVIVVGATNAGKSSIMLRFTEGKFSYAHEATIGVDFHSKTLETTNNWVARLNIWDTAGQDDFQSVAKMYYRESAAAMVVFDATDRKSFQQVSRWLTVVRENTQNKQITIVLIANKTDCNEEDREVTREEGEAYARERNLMYFEVSAKSGAGVNLAFTSLASSIVRKFEQGLLSYDEPTHGIRRPPPVTSTPRGSGNNNNGAAAGGKRGLASVDPTRPVKSSMFSLCCT